MKKASVKKANKLLENRVNEMKAFNKRKEPADSQKVLQNLVFRDEAWDGW